MESAVHVSKYNFYSINATGCYLYNARTGCILRISEKIKSALEKRTCLLADDLHESVISPLVEAGAVYESGSELDFIENKIRQAEDKHRYQHVVITPTIACNFLCEYCFQNEYRQKYRMSKETYSAIVSFLVKQIKKGNKPAITWFGGEPLSAFKDMIFFYEAVASAGISGNLGSQKIITNGSLLDAGRCEALFAWGVREAQITIDSLRYVYGKSRGALTEKDELSPILRNAITARQVGMNVAIRINVTQTNVPDLGLIKQVLHENDLEHYLARVEDPVEERDHLASGKDMRMTLSRKSYSSLDVADLMNPRGIQRLFSMLTPKSHFCGATDGSMLVVAPDGSLSRCWNSAGVQAESFGNILAMGYDLQNRSPVEETWSRYRAASYDECRSCRVMPLCLGGCAHPRSMSDISHPPCSPIKFQVQSVLDYVLRASKLPV